MSVKKVNGQVYNRVEATFNSKNEIDMQLYNYLMKKSKVIGKSNYIKQLIYAAMEKEYK